MIKEATSYTIDFSFLKDYKIFLITLVVLILLWGFILYVKWNNNRLYNKTNDLVNKWQNTCPDYWTNTGNNNCKNDFNFGSCPEESEKNFDNFTDEEKCKWSKECNVPWNGIDNLCVK